MFHARSSVVTLIGALAIVGGCSGGSGAVAPSGATLSNPLASSAAQASSEPAAATAVAASQQPAAAGGTLPSDPCKLVTAADVTAVYGGKVKALGLDENGACPFEITAKAKAGESAAAGEFAVSFGDRFTPYDTAKKLFGDGVTKVEGLGTDGYAVGGFIHAKVGGGELVVGGVWVGNYDRAMLAAEAVEMTKLLLSRL